MADEVKEPKPMKPKTREYMVIRKFGYSGGTAEIDSVVTLTAAEAKHANKHKCLAPVIDEDDE